MQLKLLFILILPLFVALAGCNSKKSGNSNEYSKITEKGKIINHVICKKDINQNYSLYLPLDYSPEKKYPVIYFFDPHAKGTKVIAQYYSLAEKYDFIIAASNNSKNGLSWDETSNIFDNMFDDTKNKLSIDLKRVYTAGFSGGARVASSIAIFKGGIMSVICCGAGFPQIDNPITNKFNFIGVVGNNDFNFIEMNNLNEALNNSSIPHHLITFEGKHEWPDSSIFSDCFRWIILNSVKEKVIPVDNKLVSEFISENISAINSEKSSLSIENIYNIYNKIVNFLSDIYNVSSFKNSMDSIYKSNNYQIFLKNVKEINSMENYKMQEYIISFKSKPLQWWKVEINNLNNNISTKQNKLEINLNKRLKNYISMLSYVNIDHLLKTDENTKIKDYLQIYYLVDSLNPDFKYFLGCYNIKQNQIDKGLKCLSEAINSGFNDLEKLKQDGFFEAIENNSKYQEIIRLIKE